MSTNNDTEPLKPCDGSMTAEEIILLLLQHPYPYDLMTIREDVRQYEDEDTARQEMDIYCTYEFMMEQRKLWSDTIKLAERFLDSKKSNPLKSA